MYKYNNKFYIIIGRRLKRTNYRPSLFKVSSITNMMGINNWTKKIYYLMLPGVYSPYDKIDINDGIYHNISIYGTWPTDEFSKISALSDIIHFGHGIRLKNQYIAIV